jgi:hypothetical protein
MATKLVNGVAVEMSDAEVAALEASRVPSLADARAAAVKTIDTDADAIYRAVLGERAEEYRIAEEEARAFAMASYAGPPPASVAAWASAKGWTAQAACDDIMATADAWRSANASIRTARLAHKVRAGTAVDVAAVTTVLTSWAATLAAIRAGLGLG